MKGGNDVVEKGLFIFNAVTIPVLAGLFTLEALSIGAHPVTSEIAHIFMGALITYVTIKRAGRWGNGKENLRKGEWIAMGFLAYTMLALVPLYVILPNMEWPSMLTPVTFEILGLMAGNEVVKTVNRCTRKNNET